MSLDQVEQRARRRPADVGLVSLPKPRSAERQEVADAGVPVAAVQLVGRLRERHVLQRTLADAASGRSRALVLRGEEGVGKSALLGHLSGQLTGWRVLSIQAAPAEQGVPYAALRRLCGPLLHQLAALSAPQRQALERCFGPHPGTAADPALTALATYALVAHSARDYPVACLVDDAQRLDLASATALSYLGRRLGAERVALVCAARPSDDDDPLASLPALHVGGLAVPDARRLLLDRLDGPVDGSVAARIVAECRGNPRAILGLTGTWTAHELAGGFAVPDGRRLAQPLRQGWIDRIDGLPADTRLLVLTAASEPLGDPLLLRRAAELLGVDPRAIAPAVEAGLLQVQHRVQFAHPLVRDVAYGSSDLDVRARVHRALATATDPDADADRRAWHRAAATSGPEEAVAAALETSAAQAHARAGLGAAAAFLARATELSPDVRARARRAVDAAAASLEAGDLGRTRLLLDVARGLPADEPLAARTDLVAARLALATAPGNGATRLLLQAARRLERVDRRLARETCLDALASAVVGSRAEEPGGVREAARAGRALLPTDGSSGTADLVLAALVDLAEGGAAAAACRTALRAVVEDSARGESRWLWHGTVIALATWDDATARLLAERHVQRTRVTGAVGQLALALGGVAATSVLDGELAAVGSDAASTAALLFHAWRGRTEDRAVVDHQRDVAAGRGDAHGQAMADYAQAVLCNGSGDHEQALGAALRAVVEHDAVVGGWAWAELVEAAARSGRDDLAAEAAQELRRRADAAGTAWASGVSARASALVDAGSEAEESFRRAVGHLRRANVRAELARTHLLHGEWLLHVDRRSDARIELHTAHDAFVAMGMEAFAARARAALSMAGGAVRPLTGEQDALTAQEEQIAGLARDGLSNPEIGAQLFLSSRTVEWHLRKVFTKLGISSRRDLRRALGEPA